MRQKKEIFEEGSQMEIDHDSLIRDIQNIFSIPVELISDEVYLFISRTILDLSKTNELYFKKVITLLDDIPDFNEYFQNILNNHRRYEELNAFNEEVNKIRNWELERSAKLLKIELERSRSVSNENTPLSQSLKDMNKLTSSLNDSLRENQKQKQKIEKLEEENTRLKKELLLSKSLPTAQTESKRRVKQTSLFNRQGQMHQTSLMKKGNFLENDGIQSPRICNENQSLMSYNQYFSFEEDEEEMEEIKEENTQIKEQKQKSGRDVDITTQNQQLNEESGNLEGANNGFEVIANNVEELNKNPELV